MVDYLQLEVASYLGLDVLDFPYDEKACDIILHCQCTGFLQY